MSHLNRLGHNFGDHKSTQYNFSVRSRIQNTEFRTQAWTTRHYNLRVKQSGNNNVTGHKNCAVHRPAISFVCCLKRSNTIKIFYQQPRHLELNSKQLGALWEPRLMLFVQCPDFHRSEETCAGDIRVREPGPGIRAVICPEIVTLGSGPTPAPDTTT